MSKRAAKAQAAAPADAETPAEASTAAAPVANAASSTAGLLHHQVRPDPANPRKLFDQEGLDELEASITRDGLIENLAVRPIPGAIVEGGLQAYMLIAGERRWRAIGQAIANGGWPADRPIDCSVKDVDEGTARRLALVENLQRRDLKPLEEARALEELMRIEGHTTAQIAEAIGFTQRWAQQRLQLLKLPPVKQIELEQGKITIEDARRWLAEQPEPLSDKTRLVLAELIDKIARDPLTPHKDRTEVRGRTERRDDGGNGVKVSVKIDDPAVAELVKRNILNNPQRLYEEGVETGRHVLVRAYFWQGDPAELLLPGVTNAKKRAVLITELRLAVLGENEIGDPAAGVYATAWLNGPFETDPDAAALIEKARADRLDREAGWEEERRHREEIAAKAKAEASARINRLANEAAGLRSAFAAGEGAVPLQALANVADAPLPWHCDDSGCVTAANGAEVIESDYYTARDLEKRARRLLMVEAINAAAGLQTPDRRASVLDPNAPSREDFIAQVAGGLMEGDDDITQDAAFDQATRGLDAFLAEEGIDYADNDYAWDEGGVDQLVHLIQVEGLGAQIDPEEAIAEIPPAEDNDEESAALLRLAGVGQAEAVAA